MLRKSLWARGIRYRKTFRTPGGRADIALPGRRLAVFVDGCFWHGCPEHYVRPRSRNAYWDKKLSDNVRRDRRQTQGLIDHGWTTVRLWEHEVNEDLGAATAKVLRVLRSGGSSNRPGWRVVRVVSIDRARNVERRFLEKLLGRGQRLEEGPRVTTKMGRVKRKAIRLSTKQIGHKRRHLRRK